MTRKVGRCLRVKKKKRTLSQLRGSGGLTTPHSVAAALSTKKVINGETVNKKGGGSLNARKAPLNSSSQNIKKKTIRNVTGAGRLKRKVVQSSDPDEYSSSGESEENDDYDDQPTTENDLFIQQLIEMNKDNEREGIGPLPFEDECEQEETTTNKHISQSSETARKSALVKTQVKEKLALREYLRQLKDRRSLIRRGEDARTDRRELGKYIRRLTEEQKKKHAMELQAIEEEMKANMDSTQTATTIKRKQEKLVKNFSQDEEGDDEKVSGDDLRNMFAHLIA